MKKSRRVWTAGVAAMLFSSVVGSAAFLTLSSPRADFLPEPSVWQNSLLPDMSDSDARYYRSASNNSQNFMNLDFNAYGNAFSGGDAGRVALNSAGSDAGGNTGNTDGSGNAAHNSRGLDGISGSGGGNSGASSTPGSFAPSTFPAGPSAWDTVHSELERSIEPPSRARARNNGDDAGQLAEFDPDETMTPDPTEDLPPFDQQPLPERPVPEPHSLALLLLGIAGLGALRLRRNA